VSLVDWVGSGSMAGESEGPSTFFSDLTIEVPRGQVVAAAAFTGCSMGVLEQQPGLAAVFVRGYGQFDPSGDLKDVEVPAFPANGVFAISDCAFVRFRMTVMQGNAYARGLVFYFGAPDTAAGSRPPAWSVRDYTIALPGGAGSHRVMRLARGSRLPLDRILERSTAEAAQFFGVGRTKVEARPGRRKTRGPRVV
jgi:hypothetical protein